MHNHIQAVLAATAAGVLGTGLGGALGAVGGRTGRYVVAMTGFAAGLMSAVVCFELLPGAFALGSSAAALGGLAAGMAFLWAVQRRLARDDTRTGLMVLLGIALHNLPEGLAIGSGWAAAPQLGLRLALVIALHDLPEGMAVTAGLPRGRGSVVSGAVLAALGGLPTGVGALLGVWVGGVSAQMVGACLGFAAGAMLFVTTAEMTPAIWRTPGRFKAVSQLAGFLVGALVSIL